MKKLLLILTTIFSLNSFGQGLDFNYDGTGNITDVTNWVDQFDGVTNPPNFLTGNFNITTTVSLDANWDMQGFAYVNDGVNFTIGSTFTINPIGVVDITATGTITAMAGTGTITISTSAPIPFTISDPITGAASVVNHNTTSNVLSSTYKTLVISESATLSGLTAVSLTLTINATKILTLNANQLTLTKSLTGAGTITGDAAANLILNGTTANLGALNFTAGNELLNNLTLSKGGRTATLGTNLTVSGLTSLSAGSLVLNGKLLTLNGALTTTSGSLTGSATSSLSIGGAGTITGAIKTTTAGAGSSLSAFTLNRAGQTLTLNQNLTIADGTTLTNGTLSLNGKLLILNGAITLTSGSLTGSATSSLSIGGAGIISGTLTGLTALSDLTLNRAGETLILGSDLTMSGATTLTAGNLDLNGRLVTINGALTFGTGFLSGSTTSDLTIGGAGAIGGTLNMLQTSGTTRSLSDLILNRAGQTVTIGNALNIINSITPTLGTIALGAGNVTLKSTAGSKARVGVVGGSFTGTLNVETFIPGGSAGWNTLGPAGISGLTVTNWDGGGGSATAFAMTCSGCINGPTSAGGPFVSIQSDPLGNGVYTELTSTSALTPGTGYWAYVGSNLVSAIDITQTTTGAVVTGSIASGTGFMSNPYASPISIAALQASNVGLTALDVYNANAGTYTSFNGGVPSDILPMGQGFYSNGITAVTFFESNKISSNNSMLKTSETTSIGSVFKLKIDGWYGDYDNTYVRFHTNATPAFDDLLDAYKRYATPGYLGFPGPYQQYTSIATVNSNKDYAINSLPYAVTTDAVIPVVAKASGTGQYTISPVDIQNLSPNSCVILKDKLLNINHDLRTGSYVFNMADTTSAPRFELTICADQTVTSIKPLQANNNHVLIGQDGAAGVFVKTTFDKSTKSVISAYNVMGQKIIADKEIEGAENLIYLDFKDLHNQIIIIKVSNEKGQTTKKVFLN